MQIRGSVATLQDASIIDKLEPGDAIFVTDEQKVYRYNDEEKWESIESPAFNLNMSEYDLNKMVVTQLPDLRNIYQIKKILENFIRNNNSSFYMLLCNELKYYTVLMIEDNPQNDLIEDVIIECLQNQGKIKDISINKNTNAIECWLISDIDKKPHIFILFNYEQGVEKCR